MCALPLLSLSYSYLKRACFCSACRKACFSISLRKSPWSLARSLAWLPISITRCWSSTATASALWMVERRWAMINTVRPSISRSNASCTRNSFSASRALKQRPGKVSLYSPSHHDIRHKSLTNLSIWQVWSILLYKIMVRRLTCKDHTVLYLMKHDKAMIKSSLWFMMSWRQFFFGVVNYFRNGKKNYKI